MCKEQLKKPKHQNYRVCYDNGNSDTGTRVYELYKYCDCLDCNQRTAWKREPANRITLTTKDISQVDEINEFSMNWTCDNGKIQLAIVFLAF